MILRLSVLVCAVSGPLAPPCLAQSLEGVTAVVDNDYLNFWLPPDERPDHDYTHGMAISLGFGGSLLLGQFREMPAPCLPGPAVRCSRSKLTLGQQIFTPRRFGSSPVPGERPFAGWLYLHLSEEIGEPRLAHRFGLTLGVTGEPSLGRLVQERYHDAAGFPQPVGWENQLSFEPGIVAAYDYRHLLTARSLGETPVVFVFPSAGANVGTVRASAFGSVTIHVGWDVPHPWLDARRLSSPFALFGKAGLGGELVARDLFLDGSTFSDGVSVDHRIPVGMYRLGLGIRLWKVHLSYDVTARSRSYATEPGSHTYSSLTAEVRW